MKVKTTVTKTVTVELDEKEAVYMIDYIEELERFRNTGGLIPIQFAKQLKKSLQEN